MDIVGNRINQLRKLSGMTQEQLAEKINVSRQTVSRWETGGALPDLESVVKISRIFHVSLDELLLEETDAKAEKKNQVTLNDLVKMNLHNRRMMLLLISGLLFIMAGILMFTYVLALRNAVESLMYTLYRYITVEEFANASADYRCLLLPAVISGGIGAAFCICCLIQSRKK